ncbi:hypothetical protein SteCoe_17684 [Stentor coeruleus]|uniref:Peptidase C51 domain-containing protein n=1 Tax=Stentor coeruleus TaxID=5963 RepID=A0A1R2BYC2_9CILI|nr:hypothetical protein SteCoe_17684 [Stentor coeruleus]
MFIWVFFVSLSITTIKVSSSHYGDILGSNSGVIAYSNGDSSYISYESNYINDIYSGMKWQCVEYCRRWLITVRNITFESIPCASDIWHLDKVSKVNEPNNIKKNLALFRIPNGSVCPPDIGNLIIYKRVVGNLVGHVAIVVNTTKTSVYVGEQNWDNNVWLKDYSRELPLNVTDGKYYLIDNDYPIIGWMSYYDGEYKEECYDRKCDSCSKRDNTVDPYCSYI